MNAEEMKKVIIEMARTAEKNYNNAVSKNWSDSMKEERLAILAEYETLMFVLGIDKEYHEMA